MARTSKSRGASGFKMKSGNKSSFKMMGASPVREDDEFPGLLPEVGVSGRTSRDDAAQDILDASRDPDVARMRGSTTRVAAGAKGDVDVFDLPKEDKDKLYAEAERKRKLKTVDPKTGLTGEEAKRKRLAEERAKRK